MYLFFASPEDIYEDELTIRGQEAVHISRVLRFDKGDEIQVTDGNGNRYICVINRVSKQEVSAEIRQSENEERPLPYLTLCMGIIKKRDRLEFAVEKAVELGVDQLILFRGEYSLKENIRMERLDAAAQSAVKQSLRTWIPKIIIENSLERALNHYNDSSMLIVADETTSSGFSELKKSKSYFLVVGPEGGFSDGERKLLNRKASVHFSLGKKRLRTETAAIVITHHFKSMG
ncbi:MAG: 16S rRNA (uracil(1498)-N(3))-methyltransferase [Balneolaceae bacterium]|nr:MAG: 16S rRNA (uracil(1498)-N(3))-methyltransferase [Balneolaceae bacterium]